MIIKECVIFVENNSVEPRVRGYVERLTRSLPINMYYDPDNKGYDKEGQKCNLVCIIKHGANEISLFLTDDDDNTIKDGVVNFSHLSPQKWINYTQLRSRSETNMNVTEDIVNAAHLQLAEEFIKLLEKDGFRFLSQIVDSAVIGRAFIAIIREHKSREPGAPKPTDPEP